LLKRKEFKIKELACLCIFPTLLFIVMIIINLYKPADTLIKLLLHAFLQTSMLYGLICITQRSTIFKVTLITSIISAFFIQLAYGSPMSVGALISAISTSPEEAFAFVKFNLFVILFSIFIFSIFLILPLIQKNNISNSLTIIGFCYLIIPTVTDSFSEDAQTQKKVYLNSGIARGYSSWYSIVEYYVVEKTAWRLPPLHILRAITDTYHILYSEVVLESTWSNVKATKDSPSLLVIGIGESLRAGNMSLYGYHRETTPLLDRIPELEVIQHVTSAGTNTYGSVPASLTKFDNTNDLSKSIINLAKDAGYKTYWLSNQAKFSQWDFSVSAIADQADYSFFLSNDEAGVQYDNVLFEKLSEIITLPKTNDKRLVILHFYGSHMNFSDRYPVEFSRFNSTNKLLDAYDNSILYTDYIQSKIIKLLEEVQGEYMFFADHGLGDPDGQMSLSHDLRLPPKLSSLKVPLVISSKRELELEKYRGFSLFYFECIFSFWSGITASELTADDYCKKAIGQSSITYVDSNMSVNSLNTDVTKRRN
jgi:glucan phosphoethanolaminetransferase (alkaline phosphatase superfamily)